MRLRTPFYRLCCLLALTLPLTSAADQPLAFLDGNTLQGIETSPHISARLLPGMVVTPSILPKLNSGIVVNLTTDQIHRVATLLRSSSEIDPAIRTSECRYDPGLILYVHGHPLAEDAKAKPPLLATVLICLNCDLWAFQRNVDNFKRSAEAELYGSRLKPESYEPLTISKFGDSRPFRSTLEALYLEIRAAVELEQKRNFLKEMDRLAAERAATSNSSDRPPPR